MKASVFMMVVVVALVVATSAVEGAVLAIDLGSQYTELALLKGGQLEVVENEISDRKTYTAVGWTPTTKDRVFGDAAIKTLVRAPQNVVIYPQQLLGRRFGDSHVTEAVLPHLPFSVTEDSTRGTYVINVNGPKGDDASLAPEEAMGMLMRYFKRLAESDKATASGMSTTVRDIVVTVPSYLTSHERQALIDAAALADFHVISTINAPTAFAIAYGFERVENETKRVAIVDIGASGMEIAWATVSGEIDSRTNRSTITVTINDLTWEPTVGGRDFTAHLADFMMAQVKADKTDRKLWYRAIAEAENVMEALSVNKEKRFKVVSPERDYEGTITRDQFDEMCREILARIQTPIRQGLKDLEWSSLDSVQIVGGITRIPAVQTTILAAFDGKVSELHRHISGDEGGVYGAGYFAATSSSSHRSAKKLVVKDATPYSISAKTLDSADTKLFKAMSRLGSKKTLTLTTDADFDVTLFYSDGAPRAGGCAEIAKFEMSGMPTKEKYPNMTASITPKVRVHFKLAPTGLVEVTGADVEFTEISMVPVVAATKATPNTTTNDTSANDDDASLNDNDEEEKQPEKKEEKKEEKEEPKKEETAPEMKEVKKTHKLNLVVKRTGLCIKDRSAADQQASISKLNRFDQQDRLKKDMDEAKNKIEAFVYDTRADLSEDEPTEKKDVMIEFSTPAEMQELKDAVEAAAMWLEEGDADAASLTELREKFKEMNEKKEKILTRITESQLRPQMVDLLRVVTNMTREALANATALRDVPEDVVARITKQCDDAAKWLDQRVEEQSKLANSVDPAFTAEEVQVRLDEFKRVLKSFFIYPKKKPVVVETKPESEANNTNQTNTTAADETTTKETEEKKEL